MVKIQNSYHMLIGLVFVIFYRKKLILANRNFEVQHPAETLFNQLGRYEIRATREAIQTKYGMHSGMHIHDKWSNATANAYLGIRYGSILNGQLRFMPPKSPHPSNTFESQAYSFNNIGQYGPVCPQHSHPETDNYTQIFMSRQIEDCLFLNIFIPACFASSSQPGMVFWVAQYLCVYAITLRKIL